MCIRDRAREVRDTSLRVPHGAGGIIVDVKVFTRANGDELSPGVNMVVRCYIAQKRKISDGYKRQPQECLTKSGKWNMLLI